LSSKPAILPVAEEVLNHAKIVKFSGFVYRVVVSAHPVVPSVVIAWEPSGPAAWYVTPPNGRAVFDPEPPQLEDEPPFASSATPHEAEAIVADEAFADPGD
jgi:hypothetical protein